MFISVVGQAYQNLLIHITYNQFIYYTKILVYMFKDLKVYKHFYSFTNLINSNQSFWTQMLIAYS